MVNPAMKTLKMEEEMKRSQAKRKKMKGNKVKLHITINHQIINKTVKECNMKKLVLPTETTKSSQKLYTAKKINV